MSINSKNFAALLSPLVDEWYDATYKDEQSYPLVYPEIYNVKSNNKLVTTVAPILPVGLFTEQDMDGGHTEYEDPAIGSPTQFTQHKYSKGMRITEAIWKFNQTDQLKDLSQDMARSARWTEEFNGVLPLSLGWGSGDATAVQSATFSGASQTFLYADGLPLFSASHTLDGSPARVNDAYTLGTTWSNTVDGALSQTTLSSAITKLRSQPNAIGISDIMRSPDVLFVGPGNELIAHQLLANTSDNTASLNSGVVNPNSRFHIRVVVVPYFLDTGIWALRAPLKSTFGRWIWNEKPGVPAKEKDFDSDVLKVRSKMYFTCGFSDPRGWVGGGQTVT